MQDFYNFNCHYINAAFVNPIISSFDPGTVLKLILSRFREFHVRHSIWVKRQLCPTSSQYFAPW